MLNPLRYRAPCGLKYLGFQIFTTVSFFEYVLKEKGSCDSCSSKVYLYFYCDAIKVFYYYNKSHCKVSNGCGQFFHPFSSEMNYSIIEHGQVYCFGKG